MTISVTSALAALKLSAGMFAGQAQAHRVWRFPPKAVRPMPCRMNITNRRCVQTPSGSTCTGTVLLPISPRSSSHTTSRRIATVCPGRRHRPFRSRIMSASRRQILDQLMSRPLPDVR